MKAFTKLGPGMTRTPSEAHDTEAPWDDTPAVREPAPAGALQRHYPNDFPETEDDVQEPVDEAYVSPRARAGFHLRGAMRSTLGRVVVGTMLAGVLGVTAAGAWTVHRFLLHDERFIIPSSVHIETSGNVHLTRAQLLSVFGEDVERNIFRVPLAQRKADLEAIPWVQHATVMRLLPNTLRISITERTPVAFFREGAHLGLVDTNGVLLDMLPSDAGDPHYSFPVLTGLSAQDPLSTRAARMELYRKFVEEIDNAGGKGSEKVSDTLSEVDITSPEDVKVLPIDSKVLVHLGDVEFLHRYTEFRSHLNEWKQQYPHLAAADMRYDTKVVLEMEPGSVVPTNEAVASNNVPPSPGEAKKAAKPAGPVVKAPAAAAKAAAPAAKSPAKPAVAKAEARAAKPEVKPEAKPHGGAHPANASGVSASNQKMFAALAAARKAQVEESKQGPK